MIDFITRRSIIRKIERNAKALSEVESLEGGWLLAIRQALSMPTIVVAKRKGVTPAAIYQAERKEKEGGITLRQMENLAEAMGGRFVYGVVFDQPIEQIRYKRAVERAHLLSSSEPKWHSLDADEQRDWIDDKAAELLHDMPSDFWLDGEG